MLVITHHLSKGLDDFEDLENVSEMVAETSESSKDHQRESATSETTRARVHAEFAIRDQCRKNVLLCYKSNGQCLACVHPIVQFRIRHDR